MSNASQPAQLSDLFAKLRRHWTIVVATALVGLGIGVVASSYLPIRYAATASVTVNSMTTDPLNTSATSSRSINMPTEKELAQSSKVASAATDELREQYGLSAQTIRDNTTVETPQEAQVLSIRYTGATPDEAADGANALADAYLAARRDAAKNQVERLETKAKDRIKALLRAQKNAQRADGTSPELAGRSWRIQVDTLSAKLAELSSLDLDPGRVVSAAAPPAQPSTPGIVPLGIAGLLLGLFGGVPLALARRSKRPRDDDEGLRGNQGHLVIDGLPSSGRTEKWDTGTYMRTVPQAIEPERTFTIVVDPDANGGQTGRAEEDHGLSGRIRRYRRDQ